MENELKEVSFVVVDSTGYILRSGRVPSEQEAVIQPLVSGERLLVVHALLDPAKRYYVVGSELREAANITPTVSKTKLEANGVDTAIISDIPVGSTVIILGNTTRIPQTVVDQSSFSLTFSEPDTVRVFIEKRPTHGQVMVELNAV